MSEEKGDFCVDSVCMDLTVEEEHFKFASNITSAIFAAEEEYNTINEQLAESIDTLKRITPECDKTDYVLAVSCGALCGILDVFLVGKPGESPMGDISDKWFEERVKDFARLCGWKGDRNNLSSAIRRLELIFKVPYDQISMGASGKEVFALRSENHHFKSLAHNPTILGLFFSILDQFHTPNTSHFVIDGRLITLEDAGKGFQLKGNDIPSKLFCAFVNWFGHLISDMSGSSGSKGRGTGIPSPFWSWTNDVIAVKSKLGIPVTDFDKTINELALKIFEEKYDLRFQSAQAIPVFVNEVCVRLIYSVRRMINYFVSVTNEERNFRMLWEQCEPFSNATVKRMLTVAHGTFCLIDAGDAVIRGVASGGGSFNVAEFTMRLNIVGMGRFAVSLYGEAKCGTGRNKIQEDVYFYNSQKVIIEDYLEGLRCLSDVYDDGYLLTFVDDFRNSDMYKAAFLKSVELAKRRMVPEEDILETKADIDDYFRGKK